VSKGVNGGVYGDGLTIDTTGSNDNRLVLAAGKSFALRADGDLLLKGNWSFWANDAGTVGIDNTGVYAGKELDDNGNYVSAAKDWTPWEEIAASSKKLQKMTMDGVFRDIAGYAIL
jgi:hypothetical protein